jgi:hypothetical protein
MTVSPDSVFGNLFVQFYDTVNSADVTTPVNVISFIANELNTWYDFSCWVKTPAVVPVGTKLRLAHGSVAREFGAAWDIDQLAVMSQGVSEDGYSGLYSMDSITEDPINYGLYLPETASLVEDPGGSGLYDVPTGVTDISISAAPALNWFDGDTVLPANAADTLMGEAAWEDVSLDSDVSWSGTPGNSSSVYLGPSHVRRTTTVQLNAPVSESEPVLLSDPVSLQLDQWFSLLAIDPLAYPSRQAVLAILNRAPSIAVSSVRGWAVGQLTLLTKTLAARTSAINMFAPGRILLYRNPNPLYPETDWYLAIGDMTETRLIPDARRPERSWLVPFVRIERPAGLPDTMMTWQQVKDTGLTWRELRLSTWLDVLSGDLAASGVTVGTDTSVYETPTPDPLVGWWSS